MTDDRPISALFVAFTDWMLAAGHKDVSKQVQPWCGELKTADDTLKLTFNCSGDDVKDADGLAIPPYSLRIASTVYLAMCHDAQAAVIWGRSVDRLWLDGGSIRGFRAGVKLGWMAYNVDREGQPVRVDHERVGHVTDAGRAAWASHPFPRPVGMCECPIPE